ncbi:MAG: mechanosensitive ion channel [Brumimicrobium sp.]|nr:mechanosensitive ion channel [Brumimicrobium sp.]
MKELILNWIKTFYLTEKNATLETLLENEAFQMHKYFWAMGLFVAVIVLSILIWWLTREVLLGIIHSFAKKSKTKLDDVLVENKFFNAIAHVLPLLLLDYFFSIVFFAFPEVLEYTHRLSDFLMILAVLVAVRRFVNAARDVLKEKPFLQGKPVGAYAQTVKLVITIVFVVVLLSTITNQSPTFFLTSLGAMTAIIILVFKDTILGFVGSIQLSANDMVRVGDWVTMEKYGADGDVIEINLTTVKVQNFDKTITTIPTYSFISDSFKNWRGMANSGGRRIKRHINIKTDTIKFASEDLKSKLSQVKILGEFVEKRNKEIRAYNEQHGLLEGNQIHARRQTNIGLFRRYIEYYLRNNPEINQEMTLIVRQLQPSSEGLPIELYCFSKTKVWGEYEVVIADIFDHLLSVVREFELEIHQSPTGSDFARLTS